MARRWKKNVGGEIVSLTIHFNLGDVAANNEAGIRGDILKGSITGEDIYNVLPFNNTVDK